MSLPFVPESPSSGGNSGTVGVVNGSIVVGDHAYEGRTSTCRLITLKPHSLAIGSDSSEPCDDPELDGESAAPFETLTGPGGELVQVRIAVKDLKTGRVDLGPIVLQCNNGSRDCPEWTYGANSLWLFGPSLISSAKRVVRPAEMLRISLSTGAVLSTVLMPQTSRIILAPDDDGLWFGLSNESGDAPGTPVLYFIPLGSAHYSTITLSGVAVNWLAAAGHTAWASVMTSLATRSSELATFQGPSSAPSVVKDGSAAAGVIDPAEGVFDAPEVLEVTPNELVTAVDAGNAVPFSPTKVIAIDPTTGRLKTLATLASVGIGAFDGRLITGGALYILSNNDNGATLFRISL